MKKYNTKSTKHINLFRSFYRNYYAGLSKYSQRLRENPLTVKFLRDLDNMPLLERCFITDENNNPIGFCLLGFGANTQPGTDWYIQEFYIEEKHQNKGYGTKAVKELFQKHPGKYCYFVLNKNKRAKGFWDKIKNLYGCTDLTKNYDATPYTPDDCTFYAFEYVPH